MDRIEIIQRVIDHKKAKRYLEIGVRDGECFFKIKAEHKVAVDPAFDISTSAKFKSVFTNMSNFGNDFQEMTSDEYFAKIKSKGDVEPFDVVFIDGLHTYEQTSQDVLHALECTSENGVIILHDCNPTTDIMAIPAANYEAVKEMNIEGWTEEWTGDVWKAVVYLRTREDLLTCVIDCDYGVGLVRKTANIDPLVYPLEDVKHLSYQDLQLNRQKLLNLKPDSYLPDFLSSLS